MKKPAAAPTPKKKPTGTLDDFLLKKTPAAPLSSRAGNALGPAPAALSSLPANSPQADTTPLPPTLTSLLPLHAALLTSLLLHTAQNPSGTYPTFTSLKPHIERLTNKQTTLPTLRRIIWLSHYNLPPTVPPTGLHLLDYGASKTIIKFSSSPTTNLTHAETLKRRFHQQLTDFWTYHQTSTVPLAPITEHTHRATINKVLHGKSQRILQDLRATKPAAPSVPKTPAGTLTTRTTSLLDRIRAKEASLSAAPTREELVRTAAEGRVPEVAEILRGYRARGESVSLRTVVEGVRGSVKNPIGVGEAEMAVRIVGEREEWCAVRETGGVGAVVFYGFEGSGVFM